MHKTGFFANVFGEIGEKRDHVMFHFALDGVDARDLEGAALHTAAAAAWGITPNSACASQACASISNQILNLFSGVQIAAISGRE